MKFICEKLDDILKPKELSLQQKLTWACLNENFEEASKYLLQGAKITYKIFNKLYNTYSQSRKEFINTLIKFFPKQIKESDRYKILLKKSIYDFNFNDFVEALEHENINLSIYKYLNDNRFKDFLDYINNNLEKAFNPKDLKIIKDRFINLSPELPPKNYPRGYKQYRALKLIKDKNIKKRQDIIKLIYELRYGPNTFNPSSSSAGFWSTGYHNVIGKYYYKDDNKIFRLTNEGKEKLRHLHNKFKNINIDSYV